MGDNSGAKKPFDVLGDNLDITLSAARMSITVKEKFTLVFDNGEAKAGYL